jgi:riboflavin biosynthesis pyrimidine reductase
MPAPLETLYELERGAALPLPPELERLYGRLQMAQPVGRPAVIANFVTTLDGVTALNMPGGAVGDISGSNAQDRMLMGLLRATADAVIVGAGTLRSVPNHLWTPAHIYRPLADAYQALRATLGKTAPPLNVIVTARGALDLTLPVFQSDEVSTLIVTTASGAARLGGQPLPSSTQMVVAAEAGSLSASAILEATTRARQSQIILVEGGPLLMGDFFAERRLDDLFLTLAPQVAGRDASVERPGLVAGHLFAPEQPRWGTLVSVRRGESLLFLRYAFG